MAIRNLIPCRSMQDACTMHEIHAARTLWLGVSFQKQGVPFVWCLFFSIKRCISFYILLFQKHVLQWMKPPTTPLVLGTLSDLTRDKAELLAAFQLKSRTRNRGSHQMADSR